LTYGYAKFLADMRGLSHIEQERYFAMRPVLSAVYWLNTTATDWTSGVHPGGPIYPMNGTPQPMGTSAVLQQERSTVKALILAEASSDFIAAQLDYQPEVITTYEKLCWDIRGRLQARAWLHNYIFPSGVQSEISSYDFERLILRQAYTHGIQGVLEYLHLSGAILEPKKYAKTLNERNIADIAHKTATGIPTMTLTSKSGPELIAVAMNVDKADKELELKKKDSEDPSEGSPAEKMLLDGLTAAMGGPKGFQVQDPRVSSESAEEHLNDDAFKAALEVVSKETAGAVA
jgi:hypothetical protein